MIKRLAIVVLLGTTACAGTSGRKINWTAVQQLQAGVTTADDAVRALGSPTQVMTTSPGVITYTWSYAKVNLFTGQMYSESVVLQFDASGKLVAVPPSPIAPSSAVTTTDTAVR